MKTLHTRREFLRTGVLGGAMAWTLPVFIERTFFALDAAAADSAIQTVTGKDGPILVMLQLAGGNDGLNTVVPFADETYRKLRPKLGLATDAVLKVNDTVAFHPRLSGLRGLYDNGLLSVVQGVGYPNPNRSHFRSTDIWVTASDADRFESRGWLGRYFDACCEGADPAVGVSIGKQSPLAFNGEKRKGISFASPEQFRFADGEGMMMEGDDGASDGGSVQAVGGGSGGGGSALDFLRKTALDAQVSSDRILEITRKVKTTTSFPGGQLASSLGLVAKLIGGGMPTRVYYVSQGGYDTHSNQAGAHERLLGELDAGLAAFVGEMKAQGNLDRVMVVTFSEFGRRASENNSGGTDHGAAAPLFAIGGGVRPGFYGKYPSLTDLHNGDLKFNVDFRQVYASVLANWLGASPEVVLGRKFDPVGFV